MNRKAKKFGERWGGPVTVIVWLVIIAVLVWLISLAVAHAGTCRIYSDGGLGVTQCDNGSVTVTYPDGRTVHYGEEPNGGFERYPTGGWPPLPPVPRGD
jgi:hypothetical protein